MKSLSRYERDGDTEWHKGTTGIIIYVSITVFFIVCVITGIYKYKIANKFSR